LLYFKTIASICDWNRKVRPNFGFLPFYVQFGGEMGENVKCLIGIFVLSLEPNFLIRIGYADGCHCSSTCWEILKRYGKANYKRAA